MGETLTQRLIRNHSLLSCLHFEAVLLRPQSSKNVALTITIASEIDESSRVLAVVLSFDATPAVRRQNRIILPALLQALLPPIREF